MASGRVQTRFSEDCGDGEEIQDVGVLRVSVWHRDKVFEVDKGHREMSFMSRLVPGFGAGFRRVCAG